MRLVPKIKSENASSSKWNSNDLLVFTLSRLNILIFLQPKRVKPIRIIFLHQDIFLFQMKESILGTLILKIS